MWDKSEIKWQGKRSFIQNELKTMLTAANGEDT